MDCHSQLAYRDCHISNNDWQLMPRPRMVEFLFLARQLVVLARRKLSEIDLTSSYSSYQTAGNQAPQVT